MKTWITDENGNRASVERWGSEEAARRALASLGGCSGCSDCSDCSDCYRCSGCSGLKEAAPVEAQPSQRLEVPVIENLHQKLYAAVTASEEALDMGSVHACATTLTAEPGGWSPWPAKRARNWKNGLGGIWRQ